MNRKQEDGKTEKKSKWKKRLLIIVLSLIILFVGAVSLLIEFPGTVSKAISIFDNVKDIEEVTEEPQVEENQIDTNFINAVTVRDSVEEDVRSSDPLPEINKNYTCETDTKAGKASSNLIYNGRRINIAIIGIDARMGTVSNHADANNILSIMPDSGIIEITAIPRDTWANARMADSTQNKLTIVLANRGMKAYLKEAARIARLDQIPYYVEVSFSQVMGILELFGYKDTKSALQVLRSRKALGGDDYQRCYNQAQFIRQLMLNHFGKVTGPLGGILIHGGLSFVKTNLTNALVRNIVDNLEQNGFGDTPKDVIIKVRPPVGIDFKVHNFTNQETFSELQHRIEAKNRHIEKDSLFDAHVSGKLWKAIHKAEADSSHKRYRGIINSLKNFYDQRAWIQVSDLDLRENIRNRISSLMIYAYYKLKQPEKAEAVKSKIQAEKEMFEQMKQL